MRILTTVCLVFLVPGLILAQSTVPRPDPAAKQDMSQDNINGTPRITDAALHTAALPAIVPPAKPAKPKAAKKTNESDAAIAAELEDLRQALQSQQEQITQLREELAKRDRQIDEAREAAAAANARAADASAKATEAVNTTAEVKSAASSLNSTVSELKAGNEALKTTLAAEQADSKKAAEEGPTTIKYKASPLLRAGSSRRKRYSAIAPPAPTSTLLSRVFHSPATRSAR